MKLFKTLFLSIIVVFSSLGLYSGCGSTDCKILIDSTEVELAVGETHAIQINSFTIDGVSADTKLLVYSSSNARVVTVSDGVITALSLGTSTVTVKYQNEKVDIMVNVVNKTCVLELSKNTINLAIGLKTQADLPIKTFTLNGQPATATLLNCVSSNPAVATVSDGKITAVGKGETTVTVTYGTISKPLTVCVGETVSDTDATALNQNAVLLQGRTYKDGNDIVFDNVNSGLEFNFYGTELRVKFNVEAVTNNNYCYVACFIDGEQVSLTKLDKSGERYYLLTSGLSLDVHTALVVKATEQSLHGVGNRQMIIGGIYQNSNCTLITPPKKENRLKIDFYGDSITCGAGNLGSVQSSNLITAEEDGSMTYASITGRSLNAMVSMVSCSGICAKLSFFDDPNLTIYNIWDKYSMINKTAYAIDADTDYVVINLGTNDASGISLNGYTADDYKTDFLSLLTAMKGKYTGDTKFIWCYGMMDENLTVKQGIELAIAELGGETAGIYYLKLPQNQQGAQTHPTVDGHKSSASVLTQFIKSLEN